MILTVIRTRRAASDSGEDDPLEVFCRRLSIISHRDMDGTVTVVFRSMLTSGRTRPVGSSELAELTQLNRVTIIHHLQRLEQMGLVEHTERKYRLAVSDLSEAVERMREEMLRSFDEAGNLALRLDRQMGIEEGEPAARQPAQTGPRNVRTAQTGLPSASNRADAPAPRLPSEHGRVAASYKRRLRRIQE
ncbi:Uncharacterised protein [uncultured archaeon]|nr:Uncharacterised protein [uncultured archaeon]